ncbi:MAG: hypothetical protein LH478_06965, partial [Chitinophagaceae bacterium]|nr:hypothetical protein [Chitinophagaceae bacterium]
MATGVFQFGFCGTPAKIQGGTSCGEGQWSIDGCLPAYGTSYAKARSRRLPFNLRSRSYFGRNSNIFSGYIQHWKTPAER